MSEEVAMAIADAAELARLRRWARLWRASARVWRMRAQHQTRRRIYWRTRYHEATQARNQALAELARARERERIAVEAYQGQQTSYRELEALYQTMTERAQQAEGDGPTRAQPLGASNALRGAMQQTEDAKRLIAGLLGQGPPHD